MEKTKNVNEKKSKKIKKIIFIVLAIWIVLGLFGGLMTSLLDDEDAKKTAAVANGNAVSGFANIKFGTQKEVAMQTMKQAGWIQAGEEGYTNMSGVNTVQYAFTKRNYYFEGHEVLGVRLNFEEESGVFWMFSVSFDLDKKDDEKYNELVKDCTSISDFTPIKSSVSHSGEENSVFLNSNGDYCVVEWVEQGDFYELVFSYYWSDIIAK